MYASLSIFQAQPGKTEEVVRIWWESIAPVVLRQKGCRAGSMLSDRDTGKCFVIGHWDTETDARAVDASGLLREQAAKLAALLTVPPVREYYELTLPV